MQATKSIISGTNTQALTAKADLLKEEMDEAMNKVELCKVFGDDSWLFYMEVCYMEFSGLGKRNFQM